MRLLLLLFACIFSHLALAQLSGRIVDVNGNPISYANIVIEDTTEGTVSNEDGEFFLENTEAQWVVVSYIGYEDKRQNLQPNKAAIIRLRETSYTMDEVVFVANKEDPAYPIIRSAIKKRSTYRKAIKSYRADLYIKGIIRLNDTPEKIFGIDIGDLGGMLDTTGQGIVYLSESLSDFYYVYPDKTKEVMKYSKVAEGDGTYNGNTIRGSFYNIYKERFNFFTTIINPLADNAFAHYKYTLHGVELDREGNLLYKIEVIPKSWSRPLFSGFLYIREGSWKVDKLELVLKGSGIGSDFFNEVVIKQQYLDSDQGFPLLFSQHIALKGGILGFNIGGNFNYIFSNYDIDDSIEDEVSFREIFKMQEDAAITSDSLWSEIRPVPLTDNEEIEYHRKDSLRQVWNSREYQDSLDRIGNKFSPLNLLFGYSHNNSFKNVTWNLTSPLFAYRFNAVEGSSIGYDLSRTKSDTLNLSASTWKGSVRYGFLDKKWKGSLKFSYRPKSKNYTNVNVYVEDKYRQIFNYRAIAALPTSITANALVINTHTIKYFRNQGLGIDVTREIYNGFRLTFAADYGYRSLIVNQTFKSPFWKKENFESNSFPRIQADDLGNHNSVRTTLSLRIAPFQKYKEYVHERVLIPSKWPYIYLDYTQGSPIGKGETEYGLASLRISDNYFNARTLGYGRYYGLVGKFLYARDMSFIDAHHFVAGAYIPTGGSSTRYGFTILPQYDYSSFDRFAAFCYEQHFDGYISNRIPHFNVLQWNFVLGTSYLKSDDLDPYHEIVVGLENIGVKNLRLIRVNYSWAFDKNGHIKKGFTLRLNVDII